MVYAAQSPVTHEPLIFEVAGVWRRNMILRDRQTGTLWQQATGSAVYGPLMGQQLTALFAEEGTWGALKQEYPQAQFICEPARHSGLLPLRLLTRMLGITHRLAAPGLSQMDRRLDSHAIVIGVAQHGQARAYPLNALKVQGTVSDQLGGEAITITYLPPSDRVQVRGASGQALPYERQWWLGWSEFHPRSAIWGITQSVQEQTQPTQTDLLR